MDALRTHALFQGDRTALATARFGSVGLLPPAETAHRSRSLRGSSGPLV